MPSIENVKTDSLMIRTICAFIKNSVVCVGTGASAETVAVATTAVQKAKRAPHGASARICRAIKCQSTLISFPSFR